ncbi:hypothetical protein F2P79_024935 [Pimephales promelas]|nr:hypothetical protein F2P79_024935 [Pimephales promelas]
MKEGLTGLVQHGVWNQHGALRQKEAKPFPFVLELGIAGQFFVVVNGEALEQQVVYGMPGTENSSIRFLRASIFAAED